MSLADRPTTGPEADRTVHVELGPRSYDIRLVRRGTSEAFASFARSALAAGWGGRSCRSSLIVTDSGAAHLVEPIVAGLGAIEIRTERAILPAGEASKSLDRAAELYDALVRMSADRHTAVVAVGGGVVGDVAGFVAATYARGLPLLMVPTTLLAQVDSSVGGKVGVNHPRVKNIIGAFHQPTGVWIDAASLGTLPEREYRCGLAEVVKYGMILDAHLFQSLEQAAPRVAAREPEMVLRIVARSCELKADVVSRDEREENGLRAVLNFGHTVGHAIEAVAGYSGAYHHGEAVAVGMVAESRLAERLGWIEPAVTDRLTRLLDALGLPIAARGLDRGALVEAMARDKKNRDGRIRYVLPRAIGRVESTDAPTAADLDAVISELL